jgi:hypothetical protein
MVDLIEQATCRYKKLKSPYMYLHLNPTASPTHISPAPFWTKYDFALVEETLVIPPLTPLEAANPTIRAQHALTTTVHAALQGGQVRLANRHGGPTNIHHGFDAVLPRKECHDFVGEGRLIPILAASDKHGHVLVVNKRHRVVGIRLSLEDGLQKRIKRCL